MSPYASRTAPSRINLRPGQRMRLRNLLYALLLKSANDAGTVIAEGVGGSQAAFAARMTARAEELGARTANRRAWALGGAPIVNGTYTVRPSAATAAVAW